MKTYKKIYAILIVGLIFALASCEKEPMDGFMSVQHKTPDAAGTSIQIPEEGKEADQDIPSTGPDIIIDTTADFHGGTQGGN